MMTRVLVALDESPESLRAARRAAQLFGATDTEYLVINVACPPDGWTAGGEFEEVMPTPGPTRLEEAARIIEAKKPELQIAAVGAGLKDPEVFVTFGDPAEQICAAAEQHDVDVVVVGSHDKGVLRRVIDPSVADYVVHSTSRPVLVVSGDSPTESAKL